ncbi:MAG: hypothetical protein PHX54_07750 [Lentimicrobiaceae bacterium]|jgi:hypothetical protein|nr:hypothetical protein [Lentimicrobiaceae bacterium]
MMTSINEITLVYNQLLESRHKGLVDSFIKKAIRYARLRVDWYQSDTPSRVQLDAERTRAHDAFIDACNILSRNMIKIGENAEWRLKLGNNRKDIGDFACMLHAVIGIKAR